MSIHDPSDGISEEVERQLQLAISAAALAARKVIATRQTALANARADSTARAAQLRAQLDRDRTLASARCSRFSSNLAMVTPSTPPAPLFFFTRSHASRRFRRS